MLKKICKMCSDCQTAPCVGKLLIRIAVGSVFIMAGWVKLNALGMTNGFFEQLFGIAHLGTLVASIEFIAGILILVGYQTFVAGVLLSIIMVVATLKVHLRQGFAGYQFTFVLALVTLGIALIGPGKYSVANCLCKGKKTCDA